MRMGAPSQRRRLAPPLVPVLVLVLVLLVFAVSSARATTLQDHLGSHAGEEQAHQESIGFLDQMHHSSSSGNGGVGGPDHHTHHYQGNGVGGNVATGPSAGGSFVQSPEAHVPKVSKNAYLDNRSCGRLHRMRHLDWHSLWNWRSWADVLEGFWMGDVSAVAC